MTAPALQAVLFDLDGTLIDSVGLILASFRYATETVLGVEMSDEDLLRNVGMPLRPQMEILAPGRADELVAVYREHNNAHHDAMLKGYEGVPEVLDELRGRGLSLAVVTSKGTPLMMRGLDRFGLTGRFDVLVSMDDVTAHKPDPAPLLYAAERLGVAPSQCAYVGDSPHDVVAARAAGMLAVGALWGAFPPERVREAGPDLTADDIREVPALLADGAARAAEGSGREPA
ncbi:MAG: HAD family hydrolase [Actinobacteria bacterium]|nr:MAG: HAD family hydrolase [Actinomycetota bacterium]